MKQNQNILLFKEREERYKYLGLLNEYQTFHKNNTKPISYKNLSPEQYFLFKRVLHGLNAYSKEEVERMHWQKKKRIIKVWKRGQHVINCWKQTVSNKIINLYLYKLFGNNVNAIINIPADDTLKDYKNNLTLKYLGIDYDDLILKFLSEGLLPKNFINLK